MYYSSVLSLFSVWALKILVGIDREVTNCVTTQFFKNHAQLVKKVNAFHIKRVSLDHRGQNPTGKSMVGRDIITNLNLSYIWQINEFINSCIDCCLCDDDKQSS